VGRLRLCEYCGNIRYVSLLIRCLARSWSVIFALGALGALAGIDVSLPQDANISGALAVVPVLASTAGTPRTVAALGLLSTIVATGLAFVDGSGPHASMTRIVVILVATAVATQMASSRQHRERRLVDLSTVAEVAQRAIIADPKHHVGSVAIALRYQSSTRAATVGGDCFEALDTGYGTRLLLGDVRGHGLPAVRLSALVVGAFRALAQLESDLGKIAGELDLLTARYAADAGESEADGEEFVTAVLVEVRENKITIANCGHPPPLLLQPDGQILIFEAERPALPLAFGSQPCLETLVTTPGSRMLLYTDGIIESRDADGAFFDLPAAVARFAKEPLEAMLDKLLRELRQHTNDQILDDVALLAFEPRARAQQR
jgi:phosphoserine phosphatase RsbU/P